MSWKNGLWSYNPERSHAEEQVATFLYDAEVKNFQSNMPVPLEIRPDLVFFNVQKPYRCLAVFIDGQPHNSNVSKAYDEALTFILERHRIKVLRFSHTGSFSAKRLQEICESIKEYLV